MTLLKRKNKNKFGQYFTPRAIAEFMIGLADITPDSKILEPACGDGIFLELLQQQGYNNLVAYEIDRNLAKDFSFVRHESFVSAEIDEKFDLVIGNPPYIRWKNLEDELKAELSINPLWNKYFNSLCDYSYIFILKSIELLKENGQLIFICPEYWMNTTHSVTLRNYMVQNGYFEEIYHFNETPIFDRVTISTIIFKYIKSKQKSNKIRVTKFYSKKGLTPEILKQLKNKAPIKGAEYLEVSQFEVNERWLLEDDKIKKELKQLEIACQKSSCIGLYNLFDNGKISYCTIGEVCDIGNGLVSGFDKAFQLNGLKINENEKNAVIKVIKAKDIEPFFVKNVTEYIFIGEGLTEKDFQKAYPNYYLHFQKYKVQLEKRYQYNRKINYWEWVFLRNFNLFNRDEKRIFVPCKERISNKNHFRFALVESGIFPTQDVTAIFKKTSTKESIEYIAAYLNHPIIFDWLKCNGIVKGNIVEFSEKPIASIPYRKIDWDNESEVSLHNLITECVQELLRNKNKGMIKKINEILNKLLGL